MKGMSGGYTELYNKQMLKVTTSYAALTNLSLKYITCIWQLEYKRKWECFPWNLKETLSEDAYFKSKYIKKITVYKRRFLFRAGVIFWNLRHIDGDFFNLGADMFVDHRETMF